MNIDDLDFIHVWIGNFEGNYDLFSKLFDQTTFFDEGVRCPFADYLKLDTYDDDIFGWNYSDESIEKLLMNIPGSNCAKEITQRAFGEKIDKPNSIIYYGLFNLESIDHLSPSFMGLDYLGIFNGFE